MFKDIKKKRQRLRTISVAVYMTALYKFLKVWIYRERRGEGGKIE